MVEWEKLMKLCNLYYCDRTWLRIEDERISPVRRL